jgi:N-succinyldiaminopimelate aminotransferase
VLEPYYDSYVAMIQMAGGGTPPVTLRAPRLPARRRRAARGGHRRTRLILLNTPHNPTGTVLTRRSSRRSPHVAIEHDLVVVTDEVYEHLTFDGHEHIPLATLPGMFERTLTISSAARASRSPAGRSAGRPGPADLVGAVLGAKQWLTSPPARRCSRRSPSPWTHETGSPAAGARPQEKPRPALRRPGAIWASKVPSRGDLLRHHRHRRTGWEDGMAFCLALPERAGVVAIPSQVFYDDQDEGRHLVRWAFCKEPDVLRGGLRRLSVRRPARLSP